MEYVYGALLLHKLGQPIAEDNLKKVISAAVGESGVDESKIKTLIASLNGVDIDSELANATLAVSSVAAGGAGEAKPEVKKEEPKEKKEEAAEGLSALFG